MANSTPGTFDHHSRVGGPFWDGLLESEGPSFSGLPSTLIAGGRFIGRLEVTLQRICHISVSSGQLSSFQRVLQA